MGAAELFLVKSGHWAYEREWRIVRALTDAQKVLPDTPYPVHLFYYPAAALKSVILGARMTPQASLRIREIIESTDDLKHVRVRRAVPDSTHFHLQIIDDAAA